MLLPQFSLRQLFLLMAASGGISWVLSQAVQGASWALAVSAGLATSVAMFALSALVFALVWLLAGTIGTTRERVRSGSPLAEHNPAPLVNAPEEVE